MKTESIMFNISLKFASNEKIENKSLAVALETTYYTGAIFSVLEKGSEENLSNQQINYLCQLGKAITNKTADMLEEIELKK